MTNKGTVVSSRALYESMSRGELIDELCKRDRTSPDPSRLLEELQVHQVELEMQNRQLAETQHELEESRSRYADLFDLAPVAYCLFDRNGVVRDVNVAAATLLRTNRASLIGLPFTRVVEIAERQTFLDHIARCLTEEIRASTDIAMRVRGRGDVVVQLVSTPVIGTTSRIDVCRTMLVDVTRIKRAEGVFRFLAEVNEAFAAAMGQGLEATLSTIVRVCVPVLADVCFVDLCDPDAPAPLDARRVAVAPSGASEQLERAAVDPAWSKYRAQLLETLTPVFEPTSASALGVYRSQIDASALLLLPLVARGRTLGLLGALMTSSRRSYTLQDFELGQDLAPRAAIAIDNALLYEANRKAIVAQAETLAAVTRDLREPLDVVAQSLAKLDPDAAMVVHRAHARIEQVLAEAGGKEPPTPAEAPAHEAKLPVAPPSRPRPIVLLVDLDDASRKDVHGELQRHGWDVVDLGSARDAAAYINSPNNTPAAMIVDGEAIESRAVAVGLRDSAIPLVVTGQQTDLAKQMNAIGHFTKPVAIDRLLALLED